MTYDWEFGELDCYKSHEGQTDVVFNIAWRLNARESGYSASDWGHLKVTYTDGQPFVPFPDLTEELVRGWCENGLDVDTIKAALRARVLEAKNPTTEALDPPWATNGAD
jgi:hypothetical protein